MSSFLEKMNSDCLLGTMLSEINSPNIPRVLRACGFDYVIIDCEHGYFDYTSAANLVSVSQLCGLLPIIRIASPERNSVQKYLDMGAAGLLLAMTETPEQAENLVSLSKYPPEGKRGISLQRPHTGYLPGNPGDYLARANANVILLAQIESTTGVSNISQIAGISGIDGIMIGPNDLTLNMGCLGQYDHPDVVRIFHSILSTTTSFQKPCGLISSNLSLLKKWKNMGMRLLSWNSEIGMILNEGKWGVCQLK